MAASRNTVALPPDLLAEAARAAGRRGIAVEDWVGECVRASLTRTPPADRGAADTDPLFADTATFEDDGPTDLAARHDEYLNEPAPAAGGAP